MRSAEEVGWAQLRNAEWSSARTSFESALLVRESPEALEGLSWAAWWLDDEPTVFDARKRAYRLYRESGAPASAARMATWLAADHVDFHGAFSVAGGWLRRARRLLESIAPGPDHGWLAFHEGFLAQISNEFARAQELAIDAARIGRQFGVPDLEMLGLALEGASFVSRGHVERGMRCLDEATASALAGEATIPISIAWTCCFLVTSCLSVRDYDRASEWCDRIVGFAARYGSRYMLAFCRAEYGAIHLWRGRWTDAEDLLERSVEDFSRSRPAWVGGPLVNLAELRRRQGRRADAEALLDRAGSSLGAQICRARIAMDQGDYLRAFELLDRTLRQVPEYKRSSRAALLEVLVHAHTARGDLEAAASSLEQMREIVRLVGTRPLEASADLAEGILRAAGGEHERARVLLEDALDCFQRSGAAFECSQVRIALSSCLSSLGRTDAATREAAAARDALVELGGNAEPARRLLERPAPAADKPSELTPREHEVLELLADALTNRQIADRLNVSEHTVHRHVTNILRKLELPSRTAAAALAVRSGLR